MTEIKEFLKSETKISKDCRVKYWLFCKILDLSVYKKRRGKVPSSILNDVSDI